MTNAGQIVPGVVTSALLYNPVLQVYDSTIRGGYSYENDRGRVLGNPIAEAREYNSITNLSRFLGNLFARYKILPYLEFKTSFGIDEFFNNESSYGPSFLKRAQASNGEASLGRSNGLTWLNENTFTFNKSIGNDHRLNAVAGFTMQQFNNEKQFVYAFDFPDDRTGYHNIATALKPQKPFNTESQWNMVSYLGRVNYTLKDRYLFTVTGRVDGSSKFAEGRKYGFFPSAAFAWRISKEKFMEDVAEVNDLKLRVSYGILGNQAIPPYASLALVGPYGEGVFNSSSGSEVYTGQEPLSYVNKDLKWETTKQFDIGMDITMFDSRLSLNADYYKKMTYDLLLATPIPLTSGFSSTLLNIGNIENHGFDFNMHTINLKRGVEWSSDFNFSINRNTITNLNSNTDIILMGSLLLREGASIGTFYGYKFDGIFQTDADAAKNPVLSGQEPNSPNPASRAKAGDRKYLDQNGDGKIDSKDRIILGSANPKFIYGLTNSIKFKDLEFNFFLQGAYGNSLANYNNFDLMNFTGQNNVLAEAGLNRWTPQNPSNQYPRALAAGSLDQGVFSSSLVENASYLRIKSVNIAYNLPAKIMNKAHLGGVKVFLSGLNLLTITNYSGYDPEANTYGQSTTIVGIDQGGYPQAKVIQAGISVIF
ncbi:MAG: SusC/RagA family TonB-linked outer membrane protein [Sphingobacteriales bacterium]|nr:SusC/RagA family TonB-linked outer membrane protein [Sphingobacteriales bacterium]